MQILFDNYGLTKTTFIRKRVCKKIKRSEVTLASDILCRIMLLRKQTCCRRVTQSTSAELDVNRLRLTAVQHLINGQKVI